LINKSRKEKQKGLYPANFKYKIKIAQDLVREFGLKRFFIAIIPFLFFRKYIFCSQLIDSIASSSPCEIPFQIELANKKDIQHIIRLRPNYYTSSILQRRFQEGHLCFLGWSGDIPIHIRWIFIDSIYLPYLHRTFVTSPGEVYGDDGYTDPRFRRKGVYAYAGHLMRLKLMDMGYNRLTCVFASWHSELLEFCENTGLKKVGEERYWNLFGYKKFTLKGLVRELDHRKISINDLV
jgi:hypothetical protein